ncbi:MAG: hypothetical protein H7Y08_01215, partial [Rhizobiaceae bacterium]|nr:hypothetical protein [Rhizobiaceae bacterium]
LGSTAGSDVGGSSSGQGITGGLNSSGAGSTDVLGNQSVVPSNVDSIARSGNAGAATGLGGTGRSGAGGSNEVEQPLSRSGAGSPAEYDIRQPGVGVDLQSIRGALAADPSATPKPNGD